MASYKKFDLSDIEMLKEWAEKEGDKCWVDGWFSDQLEKELRKTHMIITINMGCGYETRIAKVW